MWLLQLNRRTFFSLGLGPLLSVLFPKLSLGLGNPSPSGEVITHFQKWSHIATGFSDITFDESRDYLIFCLRRGLKEKDITNLDPLHYKGTSVEKKLLEGWMTGLMHLHGSRVDRHYDTMLMWRAAGLDMKPLSCLKETRSWSQAPLEQ